MKKLIEADLVKIRTALEEETLAKALEAMAGVLDELCEQKRLDRPELERKASVIYNKEADSLLLLWAKNKPAVSHDVEGEFWLRIVPETSEIIGIEIEDFSLHFLRKYIKGLDSPDREKIEQLQILLGYALIALNEEHITTDEMDLYRDFITNSLVALIPDIEELDKIREEINRLNKKLDDREEDLIEAKKQERERIMALIKGFTANVACRRYKDDLLLYVFGQALGEK